MYIKFHISGKHLQKMTGSMRIFTYNLLIFLVLLFACFGCEDNLFDFGSKKDENDLKLPPATQSGENTLGCKINGEIWKPRLQITLFPPPFSYISGDVDHERNRFSLSARRNVDKKTIDAEIRMTVHDSLQTSKKYPFTYYSDTTNYASIERHDTCRFRTDNTTNGYVVLTKIDTSENIVSGRFQFNAINKNCGQNDKMKITEGRFDIDYKEY